jgi:hypothetical protein
VRQRTDDPARKKGAAHAITGLRGAQIDFD